MVDTPDDREEQAESPTLSDRLLDLFVFLPTGVAVTVAEELPHLAERGRERLGVHVNSARAVGHFAVTAGGHELKKRSAARGPHAPVERVTRPARAAPARRPVPGCAPSRTRTTVRHRRQGPPDGSCRVDRRSVDPPVASTPASATSGPPVRRPAPAVPPPPVDAHTPDVTSLAIPGFDTLSASQVVQRLDGLTRGELVSVRAYETSGRGRRTILSRVTSCSTSGPEPVVGDGHTEVPVEQVRSATTDDLDRLVELVAAFLASRADRRGAALARPSDSGGRLRLRRRRTRPVRVGPDVRPWWAPWTTGSPVRPCAGWRRTGHDRRGVLDLCFVEDGAREVGLGHLLVESALDWFRGHGCTGVDGTAHPGDRAAKNFFESAGFKARLLVMHRPLD